MYIMFFRFLFVFFVSNICFAIIGSAVVSIGVCSYLYTISVLLYLHIVI